MAKISKKDLIRRIKKETDAIEVPDMTKTIISRIDPEPMIVKEKKSYKFQLRFAMLILTALLLVVGGVYLFKNDTTTQPEEPIITKPQQVYGLQAVTLFNFANNEQTNAIMAKRMQKLANNDQYQKIAREINDYLLSAADILQQDKVEYIVGKSDNPNYQTKMTIKIKMYDKEEHYTLYFNETADKDYDDIDEVSSKIEGIIKTNSDEFYFDGNKEVETAEKEIELRMYINKNKTEYYEVSQEMEKNETEFSYGYYLNGKLIEEVEISLENTSVGKVIEMEVIESSRELEFEFHYKENYILIIYEIDENEGNVEAYIKEDHTLYKFNNEEIKIY